MLAALEAESTLTDRYQTTVPELVRRALHLEKRDKITYTVLPDGSVRMTRTTLPDECPVQDLFVGFAAQESSPQPEPPAIDPDLAQRIQSLVGSVDLDLGAP